MLVWLQTFSYPCDSLRKLYNRQRQMEFPLAVFRVATCHFLLHVKFPQALADSPLCQSFCFIIENYRLNLNWITLCFYIRILDLCLFNWNLKQFYESPLSSRQLFIFSLLDCSLFRLILIGFIINKLIDVDFILIIVVGLWWSSLFAILKYSLFEQ